MIWLKRILKTAIALFAVLLGGYGAITLYGWDKVWSSVAGPADLGQVEFSGLGKGPKPNQALICPPDLCRAGDVDAESPVYGVGAEALKAAFLDSLKAEEDLTRVDANQDDMQLRFVQRTDLLRFPDTVRVRIIPLDDERATIAIYSQSQIGQSDFGINLDRVQRWLGRLEDLRVEK